MKDRFAFGENWKQFLQVVNEDRIAVAIQSVQNLFGVKDLSGKRFLDIGCGSGLFSLAAHRLGAEVRSFDFDPAAVACTEEMRNRFAKGSTPWTISQGSALDPDFLKSLGQFDVVYSWGVLHHTGAMWKALENAATSVMPKGSLSVALYNDQGWMSGAWLAVKKTYVSLPDVLKTPYVALIGTFIELKAASGRLLRLENPLPFKNWAARRQDRGMSVWYDLVDWVGGYPFEVAKPEAITAFYRKLGFTPVLVKTCGSGLGCNEFVFRKD